MAVTLGKSPVLMTAAADAITGNWKVTTIRCVTQGAGGVFIFTDADAQEIYRSASLQANDAEESGALDYWIDGLVVSQIPAGAIAYVYYE